MLVEAWRTVLAGDCVPSALEPHAEQHPQRFRDQAACPACRPRLVGAVPPTHDDCLVWRMYSIAGLILTPAPHCFLQ